MEFSKKEIHTSVLTQSKYSQITVDDDFTIPDSKGDMEKIVAKEGHILLESMIPEDGKVRITGSVCVRVLYRTGGDIPRLCQFQSEIPFEDVVNCDGVSSSSQVDCHSQLEDLTVSMINSRKLEVRGLIGPTGRPWYASAPRCSAPGAETRKHGRKTNVLEGFVEPGQGLGS